MDVIYRTPTPEDVARFASEIRKEDERELKRWTGNPPLYELQRAVELSEICTLATLPDGTPLSLFGAANANILESEAVIWELSTRHVEEHRYLFAKASRQQFHAIARAMPHVAEFFNYVDTDYTRAINWIEWLGGTLSISGAFKGVSGGVFRRFILPNPYYEKEA